MRSPPLPSLYRRKFLGQLVAGAASLAAGGSALAATWQKINTAGACAAGSWCKLNVTTAAGQTWDKLGAASASVGTSFSLQITHIWPGDQYILSNCATAPDGTTYILTWTTFLYISITKINPSGIWQWTKWYSLSTTDGSGYGGQDARYGLVADANNVYAVVCNLGAPAILKLDTNGAIIARKTLPSNAVVGALQIKRGGSGAFYIMIIDQRGSINYPSYIMKLDAAMNNVLWEREVTYLLDGFVVDSTESYVHVASRIPAGTRPWIGRINATTGADVDGIYLTPAGATLGATSEAMGSPSIICTSDGGRLAVFVYRASLWSEGVMVITKLSSTNVVLWSKYIRTGAANKSWQTLGLVFESGGKYYFAMYRNDLITGYIVSINSDGTLNWADTVSCGALYYPLSLVAVHADGRLVFDSALNGANVGTMLFVMEPLSSKVGTKGSLTLASTTLTLNNIAVTVTALNQASTNFGGSVLLVEAPDSVAALNPNPPVAKYDW